MKTSGRIEKAVRFVNTVDAHHKLYFSVGIAAQFFFLTTNQFSQPVHYMLSWLSYVTSALMLSWITIVSSHPEEVKQEAHGQDSSQTVIFFLVIASAFASLFAILLLLKKPSPASYRDFLEMIVLPLSCVAGSWWLLHTVFSLRYAHLYYCDTHHHAEEKPKPGGLIFPDEQVPDYMDFTYFSFIIGMTFQVSDVQISSRKIRRLAWAHGVLSFAFNTFIVAFSINIIAGFIQK